MYPDNSLATWQLVMIAVVMGASLVIWLGAVFLADRQPRGASAAASAGPRDGDGAATVPQRPSAARPAGETAV